MLHPGGVVSRYLNVLSGHLLMRIFADQAHPLGRFVYGVEQSTYVAQTLAETSVFPKKISWTIRFMSVVLQNTPS